MYELTFENNRLLAVLRDAVVVALEVDTTISPDDLPFDTAVAEALLTKLAGAMCAAAPSTVLSLTQEEYYLLRAAFIVGSDLTHMSEDDYAAINYIVMVEVRS